MRQTPAHTRVTMWTVATIAAVQMATYFSRTAGHVQVRHMATVKENHLLKATWSVRDFLFHVILHCMIMHFLLGF